MNKLYNFENKIENSYYKFKYISDKINYLCVYNGYVSKINKLIYFN
jgi:hypothetical protein